MKLTGHGLSDSQQASVCKWKIQGAVSWMILLHAASQIILQLTCAEQCCCYGRGPGAGAEVTAGGVFSDLLRLAAYLGAPS